MLRLRSNAPHWPSGGAWNWPRALVLVLVRVVLDGCAPHRPAGAPAPLFLRDIGMMPRDAGWAVGSNAATPTFPNGPEPGLDHGDPPPAFAACTVSAASRSASLMIAAACF